MQTNLGANKTWKMPKLWESAPKRQSGNPGGNHEEVNGNLTNHKTERNKIFVDILINKNTWRRNNNYLAKLNNNLIKQKYIKQFTESIELRKPRAKNHSNE